MRPFSLRRALRRLDFTRVLMEARAETICIVDLTGRICLVNGATERLLGWSERHLLGQDAHEVLHRCAGAPEDCPLRATFLSTSPFRHGDDMLRRHDGTTVPVTYQASPLVIEGKVAGTMLVFRDRSAQERELQALRDSEQRYRLLAEAAPEAMWLTDPFGYITMANARCAELFGYPTWHALLQRNTLELIELDDRPAATQARHASQQGNQITSTLHLVGADGGRVGGAQVRVSPVWDTDGRIMAYLYAARPEERATPAAVPAPAVSLEGAIALALSSSPLLVDAIPRVLQTVCEHGGWDIGLFWQVDGDEQVLRCEGQWHASDARFPSFTGISRQLSLAPGVDLPGRVWSRNEAVWLTDLVADNDILRSLAASQDGLHGAFGFPISVSGALHGVMEFISREARQAEEALMQGADAASAQVGWFLERHQVEKTLRHQAQHDVLTGLPNRSLLLDRLRRSLFVARETGRPVSLFLIDLDEFKGVNDRHGHVVGDELLVAVAQRLQGALRDTDTIARLGGDEFAVLLPGTSEAGAIVVAQKVVEALEGSFPINDVQCVVGGSIGIAVYPNHGSDPTGLLESADAAMYVAKRNGTGYAVYVPQSESASPPAMPPRLGPRLPQSRMV